MKTVLTLAASCAALALGSVARATDYQITVLDPTGSVYAYASGVNDAGHVAGSYSDGSMYHGFLYDSGAYTVLDVPGALDTYASDVNYADYVVGYYTGSDGYNHGFLYANGSYTLLGDAFGGPDSIPYGLNASGDLVGVAGDVQSGYYSFTSHNGQYTPLFAPNAFRTYVYQINAFGEVVGWYYNTAGSYGFAETGGQFTILTTPDGENFFPGGNDDNGDIIGSATNANGHSRILIDSGGVFTPFDLPGAANLAFADLNDSRQVVGSYDEGFFHTVGFLATPVQVTPEPASWATLGLGALSLLALARRAKKAT